MQFLTPPPRLNTYSYRYLNGSSCTYTNLKNFLMKICKNLTKYEKHDVENLLSKGGGGVSGKYTKNRKVQVFDVLLVTYLLTQIGDPGKVTKFYVCLHKDVLMYTRKGVYPLF